MRLLSIYLFLFCLPALAIQSGIKARGQYKAVVHLRILKGASQGWCSGSLIHPLVVITAAHCVENSDAQNVLIGVGDNANQMASFELTKAIATYIHPAYDKHNYLNDIAVVILEQPINIDSNDLMRLPYPERPRFNYATIVGFGHGGEGQEIGIKKHKELKLLNNNDCSAARNIYSLSAGAKNGDSGGPLLLNGTNEVIGVAASTQKAYYYTTGIIFKREHRCPERSHYTNIFSYLRWIKNITLMDYKQNLKFTTDFLKKKYNLNTSVHPANNEGFEISPNASIKFYLEKMDLIDDLDSLRVVFRYCDQSQCEKVSSFGAIYRGRPLWSAPALLLYYGDLLNVKKKLPNGKLEIVLEKSGYPNDVVLYTKRLNYDLSSYFSKETYEHGHSQSRTFKSDDVVFSIKIRD
ncbi:MAG: trypsin-like serine protease [Bacteriovoracaceae bacterium]|nr:trypsin-like serine protease [Bacteriovoracaceae bacterium]